MLQQNLINAILPLIIGMAPFTLLVWALVKFRKRKSLQRKNPINTHLLRSPGQTLIEEMDEISIDLFSHLLMTPFISLSLYVYFLNTKQSKLFLFFFASTLVSFLVYVGFKITRLINKQDALRLGYDAELAVGQELNLLMRQGFYVYHDVNLKTTINKFNIDHVVVGKSGIFAIETKGRSKPTRNIDKDSSKVVFDGKKLVFPLWEESEPIEQAKRQASTLQKWLTSAIGEPVIVKAVVALPGWYSSTTIKNPEVAVINGKNPENFFSSNKGKELSDKQIAQISHQLDSLCRNVEPRAYSSPK